MTMKTLLAYSRVIYPSRIRWFSRTVRPLPFTYERHPELTRDGRYAQLTNEDVAHFRKIIPEGVYTQEDVLQQHNVDWLQMYKGNSKLVLKPKKTEEISRILDYCNQRKLAVVPQGGNTGLVGGSVPVFDEIVLSTSLMNNVTKFDETTGILTCQAGCILESLDNYLSNHGYMMPLELGAKGSCQIGGNVATNAGGVRLLRYGSLHGSVLGLEVVLANGDVLDTLLPLRKDNTGFDLKQVFIGSEGTLGVITAVTLLAASRPKAINAAFLAVSDFEKVLQTFRSCREHLSEILSAFEFIDDPAYQLALKHVSGIKRPFNQDYPFYLLIETSGSKKEHDEEKLGGLLSDLMDDGAVLDGILAQDLSQVASFWKLRESLPEAVARNGVNYKYDISLPLTDFYDIVGIMKERLGDLASAVVAYGHVGDGNLHLNITSNEYDPRVLDKIEPFLYQWIAERRGSISAEHGIGLMKAPFLQYSKTPVAINLMKSLKRTLDPNLILNPYKVLRDL